MKIVCILTSLIIANVLAVTETEYKKHVYTTNDYFKTISENKNKVDSSIETLICSDLPLTRLAMMLVAPEKAIGDEDGQYPEHGLKHPSTTGELLIDEKITQNSLTFDHRIEDNPNPSDELVWTMNLSDMGKFRRSITLPSIKRLLLNVESGSQTKLTDLQTCRAIAMYITGVVPTVNIVFSNIVVDDGHHDCHIIQDTDYVTRYRKFNNGFWNIKEDYSIKFKLILPTQF